MLTVATAAHNGMYGALQHPLDKLFLAGGGAALAGLLLFGIPARRRSWRTMLGMVVFGAIVGLGIGCGGSSNKGTPTGTYTVTVNGSSGTTTDSVPVTVTVQ